MRLAAHLGRPRLWVKREDCTGIGFGGNKLAAVAAKLGFAFHPAVYLGRVARPGVAARRFQRVIDIWTISRRPR